MLRAAGSIRDGGRDPLLTMPRLLGCFNPLSVYFCYRRDGALAAIARGGQHLRPAPRLSHSGRAERGTDVVRQCCAKQFYVSPFMDMALTYGFRFHRPTSSCALTSSAPTQGRCWTARYNAGRDALDRCGVAAAFFALPALTLRSSAASIGRP